MKKRTRSLIMVGALSISILTYNFSNITATELDSEPPQIAAPIKSPVINDISQQYVNQLGQVIAVGLNDERKGDTDVMENTYDYIENESGRFLGSAELGTPESPSKNGGEVQIINGQQATIGNADDIYFTIENNSKLCFAFENTSAAILEIGYFDDKGNKYIACASTDGKVSGANINITVEKAGNYKFYVRNFSSDLITIKNAKVTF